MGQMQTLNNEHKSKSAFLNEIRGRLLELSCGSELAKGIGLLNAFYDGLGQEKIKELQQYQDFLRQEDLGSYRFICEAGRLFSSSFGQDQSTSIRSVCMVGQSAISANDETDLMIKGREEDQLISIKLIKNNAYINTKSAGIKSIFSKYFDDFNFQKQLNQSVDIFFEQMKINFFNHYGFEERGLSFAELLKEEGLSDRPGDLEGEVKGFVLDFYKKCIDEIRKNFINLYEKKKSSFIEMLAPLSGFSSKEIIKYIFFHDPDYLALEMEVHDITSLKTDEIQISEVKGHTSFLISMKKLDLQIRVKPMNSFLSPSLKVNCSVKYKKSPE